MIIFISFYKHIRDKSEKFKQDTITTTSNKLKFCIKKRDIKRLTNKLKIEDNVNKNDNLKSRKIKVSIKQHLSVKSEDICLSKNFSNENAQNSGSTLGITNKTSILKNVSNIKNCFNGSSPRVKKDNKEAKEAKDITYSYQNTKTESTPKYIKLTPLSTENNNNFIPYRNNSNVNINTDESFVETLEVSSENEKENNPEISNTKDSKKSKLILPPLRFPLDSYLNNGSSSVSNIKLPKKLSAVNIKNTYNLKMKQFESNSHEESPINNQQKGMGLPTNRTHKSNNTTSPTNQRETLNINMNSKIINDINVNNQPKSVRNSWDNPLRKIYKYTDSQMSQINQLKKVKNLPLKEYQTKMVS